MAPKEATPDNEGFRYITKRSKGWQSQLRHGGKMLYGGCTYATPREAAHGADCLLFFIHGEDYEEYQVPELMTAERKAQLAAHGGLAAYLDALKAAADAKQDERFRKGSSKFRGVTCDKRNRERPWVMSIRLGGALRQQLYSSEEEAARAYDQHVMRRDGSAAKLNFGPASRYVGEGPGFLLTPAELAAIDAARAAGKRAPAPPKPPKAKGKQRAKPAARRGVAAAGGASGSGGGVAAAAAAVGHNEGESDSEASDYGSDWEQLPWEAEQRRRLWRLAHSQCWTAAERAAYASVHMTLPDELISPEEARQLAQHMHDTGLMQRWFDWADEWEDNFEASYEAEAEAAARAAQAAVGTPREAAAAAEAARLAEKAYWWVRDLPTNEELLERFVGSLRDENVARLHEIRRQWPLGAALHSEGRYWLPDGSPNIPAAVNAVKHLEATLGPSLPQLPTTDDKDRHLIMLLDLRRWLEYQGVEYEGRTVEQCKALRWAIGRGGDAADAFEYPDSDAQEEEDGPGGSAEGGASGSANGDGGGAAASPKPRPKFFKPPLRWLPPGFQLPRLDQYGNQPRMQRLMRELVDAAHGKFEAGRHVDAAQEAAEEAAQAALAQPVPLAPPPPSPEEQAVRAAVAEAAERAEPSAAPEAGSTESAPKAAASGAAAAPAFQFGSGAAPPIAKFGGLSLGWAAGAAAGEGAADAPMLEASGSGAGCLSGGHSGGGGSPAPCSFTFGAGLGSDASGGVPSCSGGAAARAPLADADDSPFHFPLRFGASPVPGLGGEEGGGGPQARAADASDMGATEVAALLAALQEAETRYDEPGWFGAATTLSPDQLWEAQAAAEAAGEEVAGRLQQLAEEADRLDARLCKYLWDVQQRWRDRQFHMLCRYWEGHAIVHARQGNTDWLIKYLGPEWLQRMTAAAQPGAHPLFGTWGWSSTLPPIEIGFARIEMEMTGVIPTTPVSDGLAAALALDGLHDKLEALGRLQERAAAVPSLDVPTLQHWLAAIKEQGAAGKPLLGLAPEADWEWCCRRWDWRAHKRAFPKFWSGTHPWRFLDRMDALQLDGGAVGVLPGQQAAAVRLQGGDAIAAADRADETAAREHEAAQA